jgi:hypothetical protein
VFATLSTESIYIHDSNPGRDNGYTEVLRGFPESLQANAGIVPQLNNDCFLPNPFQFIIHQSSCVWGGPKSLGTAATSGLLYKPQMIDEGDCGAIGGIKRKKKTCPSATLSTTNPT